MANGLNRRFSRDQFHRLGWIGSQPPRTWAIIYVLMVPFAGFIFWALPGGSFYDSNLTREAGYKADTVTAATLLTSALRSQEQGDYSALHLPAPTWTESGFHVTLDRSSVDVLPESVHIDAAGSLTFDIQGDAGTPQNVYPSLSASFVTAIALSSSPENLIRSKSGAMLSAYEDGYASTTSPDFADPPLSVIFPDNKLLPPSKPVRYDFWVPLSTATFIERLSTAAQGDPKDASGLLIRMCYFSATTITTLGYGDITPITSTARVFVAIEAILGVVIVGLFLNAVARKWSRG